MNTDYWQVQPDFTEPPTRLIIGARVVLWVQAVLLTVAWLVPNGMAAAVLLWAPGLDDDGKAVLLLSFISTAHLLVFGVFGSMLATWFSRGGRILLATIVIYEILLAGVCVLDFLTITTSPATAPSRALLAGAALAGTYVVLALLTKEGRAYFRRERSAL